MILQFVLALGLGAAKLPVTLQSFFLNPMSSVSCGKREEQTQHGGRWRRSRAPRWSFHGNPLRICVLVFTEREGERPRERQEPLLSPLMRNFCRVSSFFFFFLPHEQCKHIQRFPTFRCILKSSPTSKPL